MTAETQAQFARRTGVTRSAVTIWKKAGRLVLVEGDLIDPEASLARLRATEGVLPMHAAQRDSLARRREEKKRAQQEPAQHSDAIDNLAGGDVVTRLGLKTKYEALRKLQAEADRAQMARDLERGDLIERAEVKKDLTDAVAVILNAAETLPDRLAPMLTGIDEQSTVRALLRDEIEQFLATVSERLGQVVNERR